MWSTDVDTALEQIIPLFISRLDCHSFKVCHNFFWLSLCKERRRKKIPIKYDKLAAGGRYLLQAIRASEQNKENPAAHFLKEDEEIFSIPQIKTKVSSARVPVKIPLSLCAKV